MNPTPAEIELHLEAYWEVFNIYPHLVVIDNITNVEVGATGTADEFERNYDPLYGRLADRTDPVIGNLQVAGNPIKLSGVPEPTEHAPPPAVEH